MRFVIQLLNERHDRDRFACDEPVLDEYLRHYARQNQERGVSRTFVATPEGTRTVVALRLSIAG